MSLQRIFETNALTEPHFLAEFHSEPSSAVKRKSARPIRIATRLLTQTNPGGTTKSSSCAIAELSSLTRRGSRRLRQSGLRHFGLYGGREHSKNCEDGGNICSTDLSVK